MDIFICKSIGKRAYEMSIFYNGNEWRNSLDNFKERIETIRYAETVSEKVNKAKEILSITDYILKYDALSIFDGMKLNDEDNYFKRFLEYRSEASIEYQYVDCDASLLCVTMYVLLSNILKVDNILPQYRSSVKYEIRKDGMRFKGDTLTSALYPIKLYLGCLWEKAHESKRLQANKKYLEFYQLFDYVAKTGIPVAPEGEWIEYCLKHSDTIWNAMDEPVRQFLRSYMMFGNYMRIPGNSYLTGNKRWLSFNTARSNRGKWDTVDTLLIKIYVFYRCHDVTYLESIFTEQHRAIAQETISWLKEFKDWKTFLEENCLYAFVNSDSLIPICMKTGKEINGISAEKYDAIPKNYQEFLVFFRQLAERIQARNVCLYEKIIKKDR